MGNYWWLRHGIVFHGHGGDADGYLSKMGYTRANNSGYFLVITAFQKNTLRRMQTVLEEYLIQGLKTEKKPAVHALDAATRRQILGHYSRASWRFPGQEAAAGEQAVEIFEQGGQLYSRLGVDAPRGLLPV